MPPALNLPVMLALVAVHCNEPSTRPTTSIAFTRLRLTPLALSPFRLFSRTSSSASRAVQCMEQTRHTLHPTPDPSGVVALQSLLQNFILGVPWWHWAIAGSCIVAFFSTYCTWARRR